MSKSAGYVSADYLRKAAEQISHIKQHSYDAMRIEPGHCVVDLGCGPGIDAVALAGYTGDKGKVYGVDIDEEMLADAEKLAVQKQCEHIVSFRQADVLQLPFADKSMHACRAERLFQVLPSRYSPGAVMAEMCRILKPGARIVLVDADWASASVDFSNTELERRLLGFFTRKLRPNGYAGRQLFNMLSVAGIEDIELAVHPMPSYDTQHTPFAEWLPSEALKAGIIDRDEASLWTGELKDRVNEKRFFACVNMITVAGSKRA